jgi:hypothetical protein
MRTLLKKDLKFYNEPVDLQIAAIRRDGGTQARAGLNEETVEDYMQAVDNQAHFPPVVVYHDGKDYWLADGFHRVEAYQRTGRMNISADMRQGTRRDAILHAAGANAAHGLRRTNADKRRAVETLLRDEEWSKWSDREIARLCAVDHKFVGKLRNEMSLGTIPSERTYTTKHGTTTTMDTSNVGKKQPPIPEPEPEPEPEEEDIPEEAMQWAEEVLGVNQQPEPEPEIDIGIAPGAKVGFKGAKFTGTFERATQEPDGIKAWVRWPSKLLEPVNPDLLIVKQQPVELPDLPTGWYWQESSNPDDIIAINRNNHAQNSGFCPTHDIAAARAWEMHQRSQQPAQPEPELPEQQPVAHPTIKQCMIDAYKLVKAGDKERAHLQAKRFRAHPDIAGIIGHAIWGMQCAMEEDSDG